MYINYSIVIPHYNTPELLKRMLSSIPERMDIQIIVVDDNSNSDEKIKLKNLQHSNLELYFEEVNCGAGHARNVGLTHVKGKWVFVVDADDVFAEKAFKLFDMYKDCDIDYLCFVIDSLDNDLKPDGAWIRSSEAVKKYCKKKSKANLLLLKYQNLICRNKMVSFDFIRRYNLKFEESLVNNDVLYGLSIGHYSSKFIVIQDVLYHSIRSAGSITRRDRTIEREFLFYLQTQKRNGFYEAIGLKHPPYYRYDFLYIPFMIKKRGLKGAWQFFKYRQEHIEEVKEAKKAYLSLIQHKD